MVGFTGIEVELQKKVVYASEQQRSDVQERRILWQKEMEQLDPTRLVFLDETWTKTNMTRLYGRAPVGQPLVDYAPHGHWMTSTFLAALRVDGLTAPLVLEGAINGEFFLAWVKQELVPTLKPGDIVIMDNLSSHKVQGVIEAIEAVGAQVKYLPPYSPDFNPIEQVFAKLKALLRKYKERTLDALWNRIGTLINVFSTQECANYLKNSGYMIH